MLLHRQHVNSYGNTYSIKLENMSLQNEIPILSKLEDFFFLFLDTVLEFRLYIYCLSLASNDYQS